MLLTLMGVTACHAQQVAAKTNLLFDVVATPNIGMEIGLSKSHTIEFNYALHPWSFGHGDSQKYIKHWMLETEYRYWTCQRFNGSFWGLHFFGGEYNAANVELPFGLYPGLAHNRYQGWYLGGGVAYGYQWVLSRHWNIEASLGLGVGVIQFERHKCEHCGKKTGDGKKTWVGPTKASLSALYIF